MATKVKPLPWGRRRVRMQVEMLASMFHDFKTVVSWPSTIESLYDANGLVVSHPDRVPQLLVLLKSFYP